MNIIPSPKDKLFAGPIEDSAYTSKVIEIRLPCGCHPETPHDWYGLGWCQIARVESMPEPSDGQLASKAMFEELNALWRIKHGMQVSG